LGHRDHCGSGIDFLRDHCTEQRKYPLIALRAL
jgi:hypothetical protein